MSLIDCLKRLGGPIVLAAVVLTPSGCKKLTEFDVGKKIPEQRVEGNPVAGLLDGFFEIPMNVDLETETDKRGTGPAKAVRLSSLKLSITETAESGGERDDFDFLDAADVFVESRKEGSELPREKVAEIRDVPQGARELDFTTFEDVNLKPSVEQGARLTAQGEGSAPSDDVTFDGKAVLTVEVL